MLTDRQCAVHLHGKGRKERVLPLWKSIASELRNWLDKSDTTPDAIGAWPWCAEQVKSNETFQGVGT